jgi:glucan 1,4-alpha-glucosidase
VGGVTDENARTAQVRFSFLPQKKTFVATIYADGKDASWNKNPQSYAIRKVLITSASLLKQPMAAGGGLAISIKEAGKDDLKKYKKL